MAAIKTVGYIGMGIMGAPMATNLLKAGFEVTVWNRTASKCEPVKDAGASVAKSPRAMAEAGPDVIILNVTDTPDVEAVLFGEDGVAAGARAGLIVIDHSTINPVETQRFAEKLAEQDVTFLDAPVSGGDTGAQQGTLSIMIGGEAAAVQRVMPIFEAEGKNIVHVGGSGMGQTAKACNQIAVACNLIGVCEAIALAKKSGLDLEKMIEVVGGGAAGSWQLTNLGPKIAKGDHDPGFMIDYILKDLGIVSDTARELKLPLNATAYAAGMFRSVSAAGDGKLGTQAVAKAYERLASLEMSNDE